MHGTPQIRTVSRSPVWAVCGDLLLVARATVDRPSDTVGTVRFTVGQKTYDAAAGALVMIPPGAPHTFANVTDHPAVMLNTFTPDLYVQYFRDLRDMIAGGQELTAQATIQTMSRYATVPATDFAEKPEG
ncbi:cupin domain-containing protein [Rhodococcus opacus]|nr:cupin domain-containing protein [Rhodococcus opacus]